jgi:hypothetical protein
VTNADAKDQERKEPIGALTVSQNTKQGYNSGDGRQMTIMSRLWIGENNPRFQENYQKKIRRTLIMNNEVMQKILFELSTRICELENEVVILKEKVNAPVGGYGTFGKEYTIPEKVNQDSELGESLKTLGEKLGIDKPILGSQE